MFILFQSLHVLAYRCGSFSADRSIYNPTDYMQTTDKYSEAPRYQPKLAITDISLTLKKSNQSGTFIIQSYQRSYYMPENSNIPVIIAKLAQSLATTTYTLGLYTYSI